MENTILINEQIELLNDLIKNNSDANYITGIRLAKNILEEKRQSIVSKTDWYAHIPTLENY